MFGDYFGGSTVPHWSHDANQGVRLVRPTEYFTNAQNFLKQSLSKGIIGYIVQNQFGVKMPMTALVFERMRNLFERGELKIVDYYRTHHAHEHAGLEGFDTESTDAIHQRFR